MGCRRAGNCLPRLKFMAYDEMVTTRSAVTIGRPFRLGGLNSRRRFVPSPRIARVGSPPKGKIKGSQLNQKLSGTTYDNAGPDAPAQELAQMEPDSRLPGVRRLLHSGFSARHGRRCRIGRDGCAHRGAGDFGGRFSPALSSPIASLPFSLRRTDERTAAEAARRRATDSAADG